jgi:16S rRNA (uracil1498-N3)-methyltransferase
VNLFYQPLIPEGSRELSPEESRHCVKVLRKRRGDEIMVTDGRGSAYRCAVEQESQSACTFIIKEELRQAKESHHIHIAIAPTKNPDRIEWFAEKATELGVDRITLVNTEHTERTFIKKERLEKIVISAMKQSVKYWKPEVTEMIGFKDVLSASDVDQRFIAYVDTGNPVHLKDVAIRGKRYVVMIGPEGDFSKDELSAALQHGFVKVSLGTSRLRTETAGLVACHLLTLVNS